MSEPEDIPQNPQDPAHSPDYAKLVHPQPDPRSVRVAGAGNFAIAVLLVSLSILFLASIVALLAIRSKSPTWPPNNFPPFPQSLWISTGVIILSSFTVQRALNQIKKNNDGHAASALWITFSLGLAFLILQVLNWFEFLHRLQPYANREGAYVGMFYTLTFLHAAHVIGGLIPLAIVAHKAAAHKYSTNFHPGVRYVTIYWHFLDIIWLLLFAVLYF